MKRILGILVVALGAGIGSAASFGTYDYFSRKKKLAPWKAGFAAGCVSALAGAGILIVASKLGMTGKMGNLGTLRLGRIQATQFPSTLAGITVSRLTGLTVDRLSGLTVDQLSGCAGCQA